MLAPKRFVVAKNIRILKNLGSRKFRYRKMRYYVHLLGLVLLVRSNLSGWFGLAGWAMLVHTV